MIKEKEGFNDEKKIVTMLIDRSYEYKIVDQYAMEFILSFGDKVHILSPDSIIEELKKNSKNILNMYK